MVKYKVTKLSYDDDDDHLAEDVQTTPIYWAMLNYDGKRTSKTTGVTTQKFDRLSAYFVCKDFLSDAHADLHYPLDNGDPRTIYGHCPQKFWDGEYLLIEIREHMEETFYKLVEPALDWVEETWFEDRQTEYLGKIFDPKRQFKSNAGRNIETEESVKMLWKLHPKWSSLETCPWGVHFVTSIIRACASFSLSGPGIQVRAGATNWLELLSKYEGLLEQFNFDISKKVKTLPGSVSSDENVFAWLSHPQNRKLIKLTDDAQCGVELIHNEGGSFSLASFLTDYRAEAMTETYEFDIPEEDLLFVYGYLKQGNAMNDILKNRSVLMDVRAVAKDFLVSAPRSSERGLYEGRHSPGNQAYGELYRLTDPDLIFLLDEYEGVPTLYKRSSVTIKDHNKTAYVYVYQG